MIRTRLAALLLGLAVALAAPGPARAADFVAAGVPKNIAASRDYGAIFRHLRDNGIDMFFPTFQYQEVPAPRSFGFESDFTPPCSGNAPAFAALRASGVRLVMPAELLYPDPGRINRVSVAADPLTQLIACAGRANIGAVTNYDEAAMHGIPESAAQALYNRVKQIDPSLPVLMVHGPIVIDKPQFSSDAKVQGYLQKVVRYSRHADAVGFDVYPVPSPIAKIATPGSKRAVVSPEQAIAGYAGFLKANFPQKDTLLVLQGFAYTDLYERGFLEANVPAAMRAMIPAPSRSQIDMMVGQAVSSGVDYIIWWGQAALKSTNAAPWPDILRAARRR
ncbi:hypothetical protein D6850_07705 [Roseovarius spongiae]|uniref:Uncharacterized protein n=1 Tax=Roseovarius spongiae TaxID=2320272 RepID=A0A3A8B5G9_9RHOB|nr:hypothetical protein [Roseovarius spongiae]RKF14756.1 hypothetical protein D6850_07705 [Roseovarius spongiae]